MAWRRVASREMESGGQGKGKSMGTVEEVAVAGVRGQDTWGRCWFLLIHDYQVSEKN